MEIFALIDSDGDTVCLVTSPKRTIAEQEMHKYWVDFYNSIDSTAITFESFEEYMDREGYSIQREFTTDIPCY